MAKKKETQEATEKVASTPKKIYVVNMPFTDKFDTSKHYSIGEEFHSTDKERVNELIRRGLIINK